MRWQHACKIQPPCDRECPGRKAGCATTCDKWAEYVAKCDKDYHNRVIMAGVNDAISDGYRRMGGTR